MSAAKAQETAKALFLESGGQMTNVEIGRRVGRDDAQVCRWKNAGEWENDLADHALSGMVGFDVEEAEKVMERINWGSPDPLEMGEITDIMTIIYKGFLYQLMNKILHGGININNFYQADQFMGRIEATIRRVQGEPDETVKHIHELEEMPGAEKDDEAIVQGMKRMHDLMRMRRRRALQAGEDMIDTQLITDEDTSVDLDAEVVDDE